MNDTKQAYSDIKKSVKKLLSSIKDPQSSLHDLQSLTDFITQLYSSLEVVSKADASGSDNFVSVTRQLIVVCLLFIGSYGQVVSNRDKLEYLCSQYKIHSNYKPPDSPQIAPNKTVDKVTPVTIPVNAGAVRESPINQVNLITRSLSTPRSSRKEDSWLSDPEYVALDSALTAHINKNYDRCESILRNRMNEIVRNTPEYQLLSEIIKFLTEKNMIACEGLLRKHLYYIRNGISSRNGNYTNSPLSPAVSPPSDKSMEANSHQTPTNDANIHPDALYRKLNNHVRRGSSHINPIDIAVSGDSGPKSDRTSYSSSKTQTSNIKHQIDKTMTNKTTRQTRQ
eukprot:TRINITY_DN6773_c0_g1_i1.p1 TRINITY_DN6773_c0_g1~~TRINITY_DN6773_c0_g1_i1.p1  ORF type:complete len:339 (-),score=66.71 TRINITY_DN6773_c0_g1_i1:23-1039(-)